MTLRLSFPLKVVVVVDGGSQYLDNRQATLTPRHQYAGSNVFFDFVLMGKLPSR